MDENPSQSSDLTVEIERRFGLPRLTVMEWIAVVGMIAVAASLFMPPQKLVGPPRRRPVVQDSAPVKGLSQIPNAGLVDSWSIESLDIADESEVVRLTETGTVTISPTTIEVSWASQGRVRQWPFEYCVEGNSSNISLVAGEWDGGIPGGGPNLYWGRFQLDGEVLRLSFSRFHRPDSFIPKQLQPMSEELSATSSSDRAWFLVLRRSD